MLRQYPVKTVSSAPATGRVFYEFLMRNIAIPASANHTIWYAGLEAQLKQPENYAFRGDIPQGRTLELVALAGKALESPASSYTFTGDESYVLVSDLSSKAREELAIPATAREKDKVFNVNFKPYEQLSPLTKMSSELAALSVPKSISSYCAGSKAKVNYSERDVVDLLAACFDNCSGPEMTHFLHGSHMAWVALAYLREQGNVAGDIMAEFHGQNPADFYTKDLGSILPALFFALASLGKEPVDFYERLGVDVWGAQEAAEYMRQYLPRG